MLRDSSWIIKEKKNKNVAKKSVRDLCELIDEDAATFDINRWIYMRVHPTNNFLCRKKVKQLITEKKRNLPW